MDDLISRYAAIDALKGLPTWWGDSGGYYGKAQPPMEALLDPNDAIWAIEKLPSAEREGKWIDITRSGGDFIWKCSECGELNLEDTYFCPNCGARMEQ